MGQLKSLYTAGGNVKWFRHEGKESGISSKSYTDLPHNPAISLLSIYPKESTTGTQISPCTCMFKAALFTVAKRSRRPKCPSVDKWINKLWYVHTTKYYSAIKRMKY